MGKPNNKQYEKTWDEFNRWRIETNPITNIPTNIKDKTRKKMIDELYLIKDESEEELIISGGALLWLYLCGNNQNSNSLEKLKKKRQWNLYLEELKIRNRFDIFGINTEDLDKDKIESALKLNSSEEGKARHSSQA